MVRANQTVPAKSISYTKFDLLPMDAFILGVWVGVWAFIRCSSVIRAVKRGVCVAICRRIARPARGFVRAGRSVIEIPRTPHGAWWRQPYRVYPLLAGPFSTGGLDECYLQL